MCTLTSINSEKYPLSTLAKYARIASSSLMTH